MTTAVSAPSAFALLGVSDVIAERLARRGIDEPFPIQAATLPDALAGRDVCGRAPTGSGKTIAFGIPLVERVGKAKPRRPRGLVLVPTRELANQVADELSLLTGRGGPTVATFFGGVGFGPQLSALRRGVDIAVACPGRLADLVSRHDFILDDVEFVVLDEADRMADMGFLPEVRRLLDQVRPDRQTLLFSATLDGDVDVLVKRYQRRPARHELVTDEDEPRLDHRFWKVSGNDRTELTATIVQRQWPAVVFVRTKRGADRLSQRLNRLGVSAAAIHGDRSQRQRESALAAFTRGRVQALVATDVAARGIHVDGVACVVHHDLPPDEKDFVHRSGRTGRAGRTGLVVAFVAGDQVADARRLQKRLGLPEGVNRPDPDGLDEAAPPPEPRDDRPVTDDPVSGAEDRDDRGRRDGSGRRSRPRRPRAEHADRTERAERAGGSGRSGERAGAKARRSAAPGSGTGRRRGDDTGPGPGSRRKSERTGAGAGAPSGSGPRRGSGKAGASAGSDARRADGPAPGPRRSARGGAAPHGSGTKRATSAGAGAGARRSGGGSGGPSGPGRSRTRSGGRAPAPPRAASGRRPR